MVLLDRPLLSFDSEGPSTFSRMTFTSINDRPLWLKRSSTIILAQMTVQFGSITLTYEWTVDFKERSRSGHPIKTWKPGHFMKSRTRTWKLFKSRTRTRIWTLKIFRSRTWTWRGQIWLWLKMFSTCRIYVGTVLFWIHMVV